MDAVTRAVTTGEDLYGLLGVSPDASDDDIRHAYRALAREHHPDANPEDARGDGFRRVAAAYEILGDERGRAAYDRALQLEGIAAQQARGAGPVASHVAPRPSGVVASRGRAASANPADRVSRVPRDEPVRPRTPLDEWRVVSVLGRILAAGVALVVIAVVALMVVSANAREPEPPPPTIWCKTPEGWFDCWRATTPDGS
jgi:DnaJ domain